MTLSNTHSYGINVYTLIPNYQDSGIDFYELQYSKYQIELKDLFWVVSQWIQLNTTQGLELENVIINKDLISIYLK